MGKYLALQGGAAIASVVFQILFGVDDPTYTKLIEIENKIDELSKRMDQWFEKVMAEIKHRDDISDYKSEQIVLNNIWKNISYLMALDRNDLFQAKEYIIQLTQYFDKISNDSWPGDKKSLVHNLA
ncbi:hypothetical protein JF50_14005, partial [Pseudoalteromonas luteoviolacea]